MLDRDRAHRLLLAVGTMGLFLLIPDTLVVPGLVVMVALLVPLGLYLVGSARAESETGRGWGWRLMALGASLYVVWFVVLVALALPAGSGPVVGGVAMGALGLVAVVDVARR